MKATEYAVDHPRMVAVGTLLVLLVAVLACILTPVQLSPAITKAIVLVAIPYPDSQPIEAENEIARKVEDALTELRGVDFMASTSLRGSCVTQIVFLDGVDPDDARREVKDLIDRIRNELPVGREVQPVVVDVDFENMPLMLVNISAPEGFDERSLKTIAEDVQDQIETVEGVANTQLYGGKEREVHVNLHPDLMTQYGLSLAQVRQALMDFHAEVPAGEFNTGRFDRSVRNETKLRTVDDIREAIVSGAEGRVIRVDDVADVVDTNRKPLSLAEFDGRPGALLIVSKDADINTLGAARAVKAKIEDLRVQYPDMTFSTARDASAEIWVMLRVLGSGAVYGALLVLILLMWTMGIRVTVLVLMAVPFSMAAAMVLLYFSAIPISNMVIFSFILALGLVVDGAIIVSENIHRHIELGEDPVEAAKIGVHEVGVPIIAADLTTIAAFLPMVLVPGIMGDFLGVMPKVVSIALLASVLVDHFIIPVIAARWYSRRPPVEAPEDPDAFDALHPGAWAIQRWYAGVLRWSLANRVFVLAWGLLALAATETLILQLGFKFFPTSDRGQFIVRYELPLGYSIEETLAASRVITEPLEHWRASGALVHFVTSVGSAGGLAMRVDDDSAAGPEFGQVQVELTPPMDRQVHEQEVIRYLRENIRPLPGMKFTVEEVQDGPPGGADVSVRLTGVDLEQLGRVATEVSRSMASQRGVTDAVTDYRPDQPQLVVEPRPEIVGLFDMTEMQIAQAVQTAIAGDNRIQITMDDEDVDLRIQLAPEHQRDPTELERLMVRSNAGGMASIGQLADLRRDVGLFSINRYERNRAVVARCDVTEPVLPADVFQRLNDDVLPALGFRPSADAERSLEGYSKKFVGLPATPAEGLQAEFTGENDERDENFAYLLRSMALGVVLIAAILAVQFNSFRLSLVVMFTVPLAFIGVVLGMAICGFPFSLASFIGLVCLTGIVVNDAIVLVDFAGNARAAGLPVREALMRSGVSRMRPVLLTTITTIGDLLPMMLNVSGGGEFWQPLTCALVFGLSFATMLTLIFIPCCYSFAYERMTPSEWALLGVLGVPVAIFTVFYTYTVLGAAPAAILGASVVALAGVFVFSSKETLPAPQP